MNDENIKKLALIISANCVRQSTIEDCKKNGQLNDTQFNQINKELSDRIYTFLTYLLNKPAQEYSVMMEAMAKNYPDDWATPEITQEFIQQQATGSSISMHQ